MKLLCLRGLPLPDCFFHAVHADMNDATDFSIAGFVDYFNRHKAAGNAETPPSRS